MKKRLFWAVFFMSLVFMTPIRSLAQCSGSDVYASPNGKCVPALVRFTVTPAYASGSVYYWDLNDGNGPILGGDTFYHQYSKSGSYGITVSIIKPDGSKCTITKPSGFVFFDGAGSLGFYAYQTVVCQVPGIVRLHDTTTNIKSRDWYINGTLYPDHSVDIYDTVKTPGDISVTLAVTNNSGCVQVVDKKNYVKVPQNIKVSFCSLLTENAAHDQITGKFRIAFDTTGLSINEIDWSFPGGSPSSYTGYSPPSVLYTDLSTFHDVSLTIKTATGCVNTDTKSSLVGKYYSVSQTNVCEKDYGFIDYTAGTAKDRDPGFYWGIASNLPSKYQVLDQNQLHARIKFGAAGKADIKIAIHYQQNCIDTIVAPAIFNVLPPIADFSSPNRSQCLTPARVVLQALNAPPSSGTNQYLWEITDSNGNQAAGSPIGPITKPDTAITLKNQGFYNVRLIVTNSGGCSDTIYRYHYIRIEQPIIKFTTTPASMCVGDTLYIKNQSPTKDDPSSPITYQWTLKNQSNSKIMFEGTTRSPKIVITYPGVYDLDVYMYNNKACGAFQHYTSVVSVNGIAATIGASANDGCAPLTKTLSTKILANIPAGAITYAWDIEPAADVNVQSPSSANTNVTFNKQECYSIAVTVKNSAGCAVKIKKDTGICIGTKAAFTIDSLGCRYAPLNITDSSGQDPDEFKWTVTPSAGVTISSDTVALPKISISKPGCYSVKLRTGHHAVAGCYDSVIHQVCIHNPPTLTSAYSPDSASHCAPRFDKFYAVGNNLKSYYWDFGDSSTYTGPDSSVTHAYLKNNNAGFTIKVVGYDSNGCSSDTIILKNYIKISGPEPSFKITTKPPCDGGVISFQNTSKFVYNYYFTYGDNTATDSNLIKPHYYKYVDYTRDSNTYIPTLYAYDETGCLASSSDIVKLYRPPFVGVYTSDTAGCTPYTAHFSDTTKYAVKFLWDFGDGSTDTIYEPNHTYTSAPSGGGPYNVTMTATTSKGCTVKSDTMRIWVHPTPQVRFGYTAAKPACYQDSVFFNGHTTVPLSTVKWDFGDSISPNDTSSLLDTKYHYQYAGRHKITLWGATSFGCKDSAADSSLVTLDSIPPTPPKIYYVTVNQSNEVHIYFEKKSAPKFAFNTLYRLFPQTAILSTKDTTDTTMAEYTPDVDVNSGPYYYGIKTTDICGFVSPYSRIHSTIYLQVQKAGNRKLKLLWNKYIGWDSVSYYEIYRLGARNKFSLLAKVTAADSIYTDSMLCPGKYTYYVAAIYPGRKYISTSNTASNSPDYIIQTSGVEMKRATVLPNNYVSVSWGPGAYANSTYTVDRNAHGLGWQNNYYLTKNLSFIDSNVDVNRYSYAYRIKVVDDCGNVGPLSSIGKTILLNGMVVNDNRNLEWTNYQLWDKGVQAYYIQMQQNDGTFNDISVNTAADTVFSDSAVHRDLKNTCYRVYAVENADPLNVDTSYSNVACPTLPARLYIPNAFSPNNDTINDVFRPVGISILNQSDSKDLEYTFRIFNRWGQMIFETHDVDAGWDGRYKGSYVPVDVYVYTIEAHGADTNRFFVRGQVTIIR